MTAISNNSDGGQQRSEDKRKIKSIYFVPSRAWALYTPRSNEYPKFEFKILTSDSCTSRTNLGVPLK